MEARNYSIIGKSIPKIDGMVKATGKAKYTGDMVLPGMLYGKILRSPHPHARIRHIGTRKAERLLGVKAVITGKDTPQIKYGLGKAIPDECPLAIDKVRYVGDEVAAVAAVDEDVAEEALGLIEVEYEPLPAVFDPIEAMASNAPLLHDHAEGNISCSFFWNFGDVDKGFKESNCIREDRFETQGTSHCSLEPHAVLASVDFSGKLTTWASKQHPFRVRSSLSQVLNKGTENIRVVKPFVGGGFGGKGEMLSLDACASILAEKTGRPIMINYTREEVFTATRHRHPVVIELKSGVKKDGTLIASRCKLISDGGAYNSYGPTTLYLSGTFLNLPYRLPNLQYEGYRVYTNKSVSGAQRGFGVVQVRFAVESQMDIIAEEINMDPVEIRLKNAVRAGDVTANKLKITSCGLAECIEKAAERADWRKKWRKLSKNRGIGIAGAGFQTGAGVHCFPTSAALSAAVIKVNEEGSLDVFTGASDIGQGSDTILSQIASEELGIPLGDIRLISADTDTTPLDWGTGSSRVTFMAGNAVREAARDVKRQLFNIAARELEANVEDLESRDRRIYVKGSPDKAIPFSAVVKAVQRSQKGAPVIGKGSYESGIQPKDFARGEGNMSPTYSFGAQIAEVEVDPETGKVKVLRITTAHDCGFALNPMAVEGQLQGSVSMGAGYALTEEIVWDGGQTMNPSFLGYGLPASSDAPAIETIIVESIDPDGPFGAKEASEGAVLPTAPAIVNAISNAIGVRIKKLPITPQKILEALQIRA